jgi:uncharacterized membrane protein YfcA
LPLISIDLAQSIAFVTAGLAAGVFSGSLGLGGALLATPLIRFLGVSPYLAIGTTVPVLFPTTLTGAWTYHRSGLVDMRAAGWTALGGAVGTVAGALSTRQINGHVLMLLTAAILIVLSIRILPRRSDDEDQGPPKPPPRPAALVALGAGAGFFSGLLGIGGGFLIVPVFIRVFGMPIKTTLGTSLAVITVITVPNIVAQTFVGNIDWVVALLLAIGVVPGAIVGARLSIRARERTLRYVVPIVVLAVAIAYAYIEIVELFSA